jgi:hypothetical protein
LFTSGRGPNCAAEVFRSAVPSGYALSAVAGPSPGVGDRSGVLSLTVRAPSGVQAVSLLLVVLIAKGSLLASLLFSSRTMPPMELVHSVASNAAQALAGALSSR